MPYPIIGLTTSQITNPSKQSETKLADAYIKAIVSAGGTPLLIPNQLPDKALDDLCSRMDGLLLTGGGDIDPNRYGGEAHQHAYNINSQRDRTEIVLLLEATKIGLPFLEICLGLQVFNVAFGGTLYEDILDQHPGALKHAYYPDWPRDHLAHIVDIDPKSQLAQVLEKSGVKVNSLHHQAVRRVSSDLLVTARAPDGIIEGLELPEHPFGIGVQWHPECLQAYAPMRTLFTKFIEAAAQYHIQNP